MLGVTRDSLHAVANGDPPLPRIRQAVIAANDLEAVVAQLREQLELGEPFADPGVEYFGLHNAVFALGDTFLEVVSPVRDGTAAGRLLDRRDGDCGYMVMFQVEDLAAARDRARELDVREVFEVDLEDISEVHLHPADIRGAIVSLSSPRPARSWRWGGPEWERRGAGGRVAGARVGVRDPEAVATRWRGVIGGSASVEFSHDEAEQGLAEIVIGGHEGREPLSVGGVRLSFVA
jgi:Glyoxalase-like domain